jgi:hypothetical protein
MEAEPRRQVYAGMESPGDLGVWQKVLFCGQRCHAGASANNAAGDTAATGAGILSRADYTGSRACNVPRAISTTGQGARHLCCQV